MEKETYNYNAHKKKPQVGPLMVRKKVIIYIWLS